MTRASRGGRGNLGRVCCTLRAPAHANALVMMMVRSLAFQLEIHNILTTKDRISVLDHQ